MVAKALGLKKIIMPEAITCVPAAAKKCLHVLERQLKRQSPGLILIWQTALKRFQDALVMRGDASGGK